MTLDQLRYIVVTADTGNITEAAKRLFISQPSLSNAIHALEKEMNLSKDEPRRHSDAGGGDASGLRQAGDGADCTDGGGVSGSWRHEAPVLGVHPALLLLGQGLLSASAGVPGAGVQLLHPGDQNL